MRSVSVLLQRYYVGTFVRGVHKTELITAQRKDWTSTRLVFHVRHPSVRYREVGNPELDGGKWVLGGLVKLGHWGSGHGDHNRDRKSCVVRLLASLKWVNR